MQNSDLTILFFTANLIFIVTNLYGWLLKSFYIPMGCREHFTELYPAQRIVASPYLIQIFEIPYLFAVGDPAMVFYINGVSVMEFPAIMLLMVYSYFFMKRFSVKRILLHLTPVFVTAVVLMLPAFRIIPFTSVYRCVMFSVVTAVFLYYFWQMVVFRNNLVNLIRRINEDEFSNPSDFSLKFAKVIRIMMVAICFFAFMCFILNDPVVKMVRDIIFIFINVWFAIYTLNPHRTACTKAVDLINAEVSPEENNKFRLTARQCGEMEKELVSLIADKKLYLEDHITMADLARHMKTNKNYLSEVISRSEYKSFYNLVNTFRINCACEIMAKNPDEKLEQIAFASGFSSGSSFSQIFKRFKDVPPTEYMKKMNR